MIEVTARLTSGSVYMAGEVIECVISFKNPEADANTKAQSSSDVCESLAWASAQIHCQCTVSDKVVFPKSSLITREDLAISNKNTSFAPCVGERGHVVLLTKPKILFCDVRLLAGESKTFIYRETLPTDSPPSYRGHAVKYSYKITVGTQRVGSTIRLLRIPIRILVLPVSGVLDSISAYSDSGEFSSSNPFLQNQGKKSQLDLAIQILQNSTARRAPNFYSIINNHGKVVRFCLFKPAYKLGEDIVGTFNFAESTVKCVQFSVTLQSEEAVRDDCHRKPYQDSSLISYGKHHEVCLFSEWTQMVLPIPLSVTPSFSTDLASLKWRLHFEFVTTNTIIDHQSSPTDTSQANDWQGPSSLDIETMVWDLPVTIYPTNPLQMTHASHGNSDVSICI